jgi:transposase
MQEIVTVERRRRWSEADKQRIVAETLQPGASVSRVARRYGLHASQLFAWRKAMRGCGGQAPQFHPVVLADTGAGEAGRPPVTHRRPWWSGWRMAIGSRYRPVSMSIDPFSGHLFVFRGRRSDLVKVIWHDGQGCCLFTKRLERGRFVWPSPADGVATLSPAQLSYLLEGIDWRLPERTWRPLAAG